VLGPPNLPNPGSLPFRSSLTWIFPRLASMRSRIFSQVRWTPPYACPPFKPALHVEADMGFTAGFEQGWKR
jgi:hypothetical protein